MENKEKNLFLEFHQNSFDFLKVLGELSMKAEAGRPVTIQIKDLRDYLSALELFWDITEKIFMKYEERVLMLKFLSVNEHAKAVILENELRDTYNELFKVRQKIPDTLLALMQKTALRKREELEKEIALKDKNQSNG